MRRKKPLAFKKKDAHKALKEIKRVMQKELKKAGINESLLEEDTIFFNQLCYRRDPNTQYWDTENATYPFIRRYKDSKLWAISVCVVKPSKGYVISGNVTPYYKDLKEERTFVPVKTNIDGYRFSAWLHRNIDLKYRVNPVANF